MWPGNAVSLTSKLEMTNIISATTLDGDRGIFPLGLALLAGRQLTVSKDSCLAGPSPSAVTCRACLLMRTDSWGRRSWKTGKHIRNSRPWWVVISAGVLEPQMKYLDTVTPTYYWLVGVWGTWSCTACQTSHWGLSPSTCPIRWTCWGTAHHQAEQTQGLAGFLP